MTWSSAKKIRASKGIEILRQTYAHASTVWAIISLAALCSACSPEPAFYDILIKNGTVIDGSGDPRQLSDVGIRAGHIAFVGTANQADDATIVIDASGLIVAPGFRRCPRRPMVGPPPKLSVLDSRCDHDGNRR